MQEFRFQLAGCYLPPFGIISCPIHQLLWSDICLRCSHICSVFVEKSSAGRCSTYSGASRCLCTFLYDDNASRLSLQTSSCLIYFSYSSRYMEHSEIMSLPPVTHLHFHFHVHRSHLPLLWLVQLVYWHCFAGYSIHTNIGGERLGITIIRLSRVQRIKNYCCKKN